MSPFHLLPFTEKPIKEISCEVNHIPRDGKHAVACPAEYKRMVKIYIRSSDTTTNRSSDTITQKARGDIKQKFRYYNNGSSDNTTTEVQTLQLQGKGATDEGNSSEYFSRPSLLSTYCFNFRASDR